MTFTFFRGDGFPKHKAQCALLNDLAAEHPSLKAVQYEIWKNTGSRKTYKSLAAKRGPLAGAIPARRARATELLHRCAAAATTSRHSHRTKTNHPALSGLELTGRQKV